jgi:NAD(P)H dehydrogenase (quinone)
VVITGASGHVGRALRQRFADLPNEVRSVGRGGDLSAAMCNAEVVVHLAGALQTIRGNTYHEANVGTVRRTIAAIQGSSVKRIVYLSYVGADPDSTNEYLATKGEAECLVRDCGVDSVVVRSTFIFGPPDDPGPSAAPFLSKNGKAVSVIGTGEQLWAVVFVGDVADALAGAALDPAAPTGTFAIAGPEALTVDAFIDAINHHHVRKRHLRRVLARVLAVGLPTLTRMMVDVLAADSLADGPLITEVLGLECQRVGQVHR